MFYFIKGTQKPLSDPLSFLGFVKQYLYNIFNSVMGLIVIILKK
jgi:hypothetical protein